MAVAAVNLAQKLAQFRKPWDPKIVGELNGQPVKLAKLEGAFIWHHHQNEDELFLVLHGSLRLEFRDGSVTLGPGELYIVPRGVEHRPVAEEETHVLLFEPVSTVNTGEERKSLGSGRLSAAEVENRAASIPVPLTHFERYRREIREVGTERFRVRY